jgi:hypothetical protein
MAKGQYYPPENHILSDAWTGIVIRQITNFPTIHHHPFFLIPAYDDAMQVNIHTCEEEQLLDLGEVTMCESGITPPPSIFLAGWPFCCVHQ